MRNLLCAVLMVSLNVLVAAAQKKSDRQDYELVGSVKSARFEHRSFDYVDGEYIESVDNTGIVVTVTFSIEGTLTSKKVDARYPFMCGYEAPDLSKRIYDLSGNLIEYLSGDTIEHSSYRLRHFYDSNGRRIETQYYDPYLLKDKWTYLYEAFDSSGNWTKRIVTRKAPVGGKFARTIHYQSISYY